MAKKFQPGRAGLAWELEGKQGGAQLAREHQRLMAVCMAMSGELTVGQIARAEGKARSTVAQWMRVARARGLEALLELHQGRGRARQLPAKAQKELHTGVRRGRWRRLKDLQPWMAQRHRVEMGLGRSARLGKKSGGRSCGCRARPTPGKTRHRWRSFGAPLRGGPSHWECPRNGRCAGGWPTNTATGSSPRCGAVGAAARAHPGTASDPLPMELHSVRAGSRRSPPGRGMPVARGPHRLEPGLPGSAWPFWIRSPGTIRPASMSCSGMGPGSIPPTGPREFPPACARSACRPAARS